MKELKTHTSKKEGAKKGNGKLDTLFSRSVKKKKKSGSEVINKML